MQMPPGTARQVGFILSRLSLTVPRPSGRNTRMLEALRLTTYISHGLPSATTPAKASPARACPSARNGSARSTITRRSGKRFRSRRAWDINLFHLFSRDDTIGPAPVPICPSRTAACRSASPRNPSVRVPGQTSRRPDIWACRPGWISASGRKAASGVL